MSNDKKLEELEGIQTNLYKEDNELFEKIMKLEDFLNSIKITKVSKTQRNLLEVQFQAMRTYHQTLRARINDLQNEIFERSK